MVSLKIDLGKKDFIWIGLVIVLIGTGFAVATWDSSNAMFHNSDDVKVTIDSIDYSLQEALDDGLIGGGMTFGAWQGRNNNQNYGPEATNGFIVVSTNWAYLDVYVGDSVAGLSIVSKEAPASQGPQPSWGSITLPIRKGQYWKVIGNTATAPLIYWVPIISSGGSSAGFTPESYSGEESITYPNGMIMKTGYHAGGDGIYAVTFATGAGIDDFSSAPVSIQLTPYGPDYHFGTPTVETSPAPSSTGFTVDINGGPYTGFYWTAIGR